jgi:hypothetical protein
VKAANHVPDGDLCGAGTAHGCGRTIVPGDAHIYVNRVAAGLHVMFCAQCCPADHSKNQHLLTGAIADQPQAKKRRSA